MKLKNRELKKMNKSIVTTSKTINPDSPIAQGLLKMLLHKKLREQFWLGEITFEELNKKLLELGIKKQYEHPSAV
ncbi:MAG: hypothetical protein HC817_02960 [Saprospiraceae bacterium]|nr:hypothetical protein [Saprospiraceae bacterium]